MKKLFLVVAALGMLATACTKDDSAVVGNESLVSFSVSSPELMTRAEDGKGQSTNHLQYAFYDENGVYLPELKGEVANFVGSTKINISLVEGRTYSAIFWADHTDAPYEVSLEHKTMAITATEFDGNADKYDAFYKYQTNIDPAKKTHTIELTRPFAQINIATADKTKAANAGFDAVATKVTVRAHSTLNLATGVVATDDYETFTYKWAALPTSPATATVGSQSYDMLAMNYVLVNDRELVDVKMEVSEVAAGDNAIERNYTTVPVQRNYRTYIVGNLLTTTNEFNVTTVPGFTDDIPANLIEAATRTITVNSAEGLLALSKLNADWADLYSNGLGTDYSNYAEVNGGKGVAFYYKWTWTIKLGADIDLKGATIDPINIDRWGTFDGQGYTIKNAKIETATNVETEAGLFIANSCALKNVVLDNIHVKGSLVGNSTAGIIAGSCNAGVDKITISNSSVWGGKYTGGVVGYGYTSVTNCTLTDCEVKGGYKLGGVIGYICASNNQLKAVEGNKLTNCTVAGTDGQYAGGKDKYIMGRIVGNFNCDGTCKNNTIVNMTTVATTDIGEIEAGKNVIAQGYYTADTAGLQAALDAAADGEIIHLTANVNYGVVYMGRPTASNNTVMYCETHDFTTTDAAAFKAHLGDGAWHSTPKYTTTLKNVTIVGAEGATIAGLVTTSGHAYGTNVHDYVLDVDKSGSVYYNTLHMENIKFQNVAFTGKIDINTSDAETTYNGVTFEGCTFTTGGTASSNGAAIRYYNESATNGHVKNIVVKDCKFNNCYQGVYVQNVNGVTVTDNEFDTTGHNAVGVQGTCDLKAVVITNNEFKNIGDRVIRFNNVGADSQITIQHNTATNSGDDAGEVIKATSIAAGVTTNVGYNNWNGGVVVNPELRDTVAKATTQTELKNALANASVETIELASGTYNADIYSNNVARKTLHIIGDGSTKIEFSNLQVRAELFDEFTIENCEILRMPNKAWGHLVFGASKDANGVYTISNCTFNGQGSQGIYINETVSGATYNIKDCTFNGDFGGEGAITIQNNDGVNHIVNVSGCTFNNIPATSHNICVLYAYNGWTLNTDLDSSDVYWK